MRTEQLSFEPWQKPRARLGTRKTSLTPPPPQYFNTDRSKAILLLWFLTVTCSCCAYLFYGSAIMLMTYFVNFRKLNDHLCGKELFIWFTASAFRKLLSVNVFSYFPFDFEGRMWDLIYRFLIIAYLFTLYEMTKTGTKWLGYEMAWVWNDWRPDISRFALMTVYNWNPNLDLLLNNSVLELIYFLSNRRNR